MCHNIWCDPTTEQLFFFVFYVFLLQVAYYFLAVLWLFECFFPLLGILANICDLPVTFIFISNSLIFKKKTPSALTSGNKSSMLQHMAFLLTGHFYIFSSNTFILVKNALRKINNYSHLQLKINKKVYCCFLING